MTMLIDNCVSTVKVWHEVHTGMMFEIMTTLVLKLNLLCLLSMVNIIQMFILIGNFQLNKYLHAMIFLRTKELGQPLVNLQTLLLFGQVSIVVLMRTIYLLLWML